VTSVQVIPTKIVSVDCIYVNRLPTVCQSDTKVLLPVKTKTVFSPPSFNTFEFFFLDESSCLDLYINLKIKILTMVGLKVHGKLGTAKCIDHKYEGNILMKFTTDSTCLAFAVSKVQICQSMCQDSTSS